MAHKGRFKGSINIHPISPTQDNACGGYRQKKVIKHELKVNRKQ